MGQVTVSSRGQITIPKQVRDGLNLTAGSQLTLDVRGQEIVLSKEDAWKQLQAAGGDMKKDFLEFRKEERELEDSRH